MHKKVFNPILGIYIRPFSLLVSLANNFRKCGCFMKVLFLRKANNESRIIQSHDARNQLCNSTSVEKKKRKEMMSTNKDKHCKFRRNVFEFPVSQKGQ